LSLVRNVIDNGKIRDTRNGTTKSLFGVMMEYDLTNNAVPLLTTKRVPYKTIWRELEWFLKGRTDVKWLNDKQVHIWDDNGTREFLDQRNLHSYEVGDLGPVYGFQWRHSGAE